MSTLANTPRFQTITLASATAGPFDITLRLFSDDLRVTVNDVETEDYTLTLTLADGFTDDATILFDAALESGDVVVIEPTLPAEREVNYSDTEPGLTRKLNIELVRIWSVLQQFARDFARGLKLPSNATQETNIPAPTAGRQVLASNAANDGFEWGPGLTDIETVAGLTAEIDTVSGIAADVTAVADDAADIGTVAANIGDVGIVADNIASVNSVADDIANVNSVADSIGDINIAADNLADITNFADVYQGPKSFAPTLRNNGNALQAGDLYFNTTSQGLFIRTGSGWSAAVFDTAGAMIASENLSDVENREVSRETINAAPNVPAVKTLSQLARRNRLNYSQVLDNAYWVKGAGVTIVANAAVAPDGTTTADKLQEVTGFASQRTIRNPTGTGVTSGKTYTISFYVKDAGRQNAAFEFSAGGLTCSGFVRLTNRDFGGLNFSGTPAATARGAIQSLPNDWLRVSITFTASATSASLQFILDPVLAGNNNSYLGDSALGLFLWGYQFEEGLLSPYQAVTDGSEFPSGVVVKNASDEFAVQPLSGRNMIINGSGRINQRGYVSGAATTGANQYTLDRWRVVTSGQNLSFTGSAAGRTMTAPAGGVEQVIEGGNILGGTYVINWTGTATATVGGTSRAKGETFTLTAGTDTTVRMTGGTFTDLQIERASLPTEFEFLKLSEELANCQRYYFETPLYAAISAASASFAFYQTVTYPATMRAAPSTTFTGGSVTNVNTATVTQQGVLTAELQVVSTSSGFMRVDGRVLRASAEF
jgi:hypothetical protein